MISTGDRPSHLSFVYRGLLISLLILGIILLAGTLYGLFFRSIPQAHNAQTTGQVSKGQSRQGQTFTGIGQMRVSTTGTPPGTAILFVTFIYNPEDKAFSEELALRVRNFREIIANYLGSFSTTELQKQNEDTIKTELLRRFNAVLRLGKIDELFFSDFLILG